MFRAGGGDFEVSDVLEINLVVFKKDWVNSCRGVNENVGSRRCDLIFWL